MMNAKEERQLFAAARILALLSLQTSQYRNDLEFRNATDEVLELTKKVGAYPDDYREGCAARGIIDREVGAAD